MSLETEVGIDHEAHEAHEDGSLVVESISGRIQPEGEAGTTPEINAESWR